MRITWLGHASFLLETDGIKIVTDPYDNSIGYKPIDIPVDIATVSHEHSDHNYVQGLRGEPQTVRGAGVTEIRGIKFRGISSFHDNAKGAERGKNTIFVIEAEELAICHLGDLGHELTGKQVREIGQVDVLLLPVGGTYTTDAKAATKVMTDLKPKMVIPMHFKTEVLDFPIKGVEPFLEGKASVRRQGSAEVEVTPNSLPAQTEIVVLEHYL
jgi:L-ascorbate metabolism protein UlaG (beta-lactamase superfamily)